MSRDKASQSDPTEFSPEYPLQTLMLSAQFSNLDMLREFVGGQAEECDLSAKAVYAVKLAADEAFTNIVEHAYEGECEENIKCTCQITEEGLVVTLRDCGHPFEPHDIPDPELEARLEERGIGGLGLYFIRQLMDEVHFSFSNDPEINRKCNILRMMKRKD